MQVEGRSDKEASVEITARGKCIMKGRKWVYLHHDV
jgi:hypothetical protein